MEIVFIIVIAAVASFLTFFSGFGLGTILLPAFIIFFPVPVAVALTAIVHFLNNLFKIYLVGRHINFGILVKFGLPAIAGAYIGAKLLFFLAETNPLFSYSINGHSFHITTINLTIAILMIVFVTLELLPLFDKIQFKKQVLLLGGILSGFFGGLSGHQGALRSMFLVKFNLGKEAFVATGVAIACLIDVSRLGIYFSHIDKNAIINNHIVLLAATLAAFIGAFAGNYFLRKTTVHFVQKLVVIMILFFAIALGTGIIHS